MDYYLLFYILAALFCSACSPFPDTHVSSELDIRVAQNAIARGYPYSVNDLNAIAAVENEIVEKLSDAKYGPRERLQLALAIDQIQHPNLPPLKLPDHSKEEFHKASIMIERFNKAAADFYDLDELEFAINLTVETIQEYENVLGPQSELLLHPLGNLGFFQKENGQLKQAEATYLRRVEIVKTRHGRGYKNSYHYAYVLEPLIDIYDEKSEWGKARPLAEHTLKTFEKFLGPHHYKNGPILTKLGGIYLATDESDKGEKSILRAIDIYENQINPDQNVHELHVEALDALSEFYEVQFYSKSQNSKIDYEYIWNKSIAAEEQAKDLAIKHLSDSHLYTKNLNEGKWIHYRGPQ